MKNHPPSSEPSQQSIPCGAPDQQFTMRHTWGRIIKSIYNLVSHCLPCNSSHNVVNHAIGIMKAFSNVNIAAKLQ